MKKLIPTALVLILTGFQVVTVAQPAHEHPAASESTPVGMQGMQGMRDEMQKKMAAAKTDAERQHIMADQRKKMQGMRGPMHAQMGGHDHSNMQGMPSGDHAMKSHMPSMREQMTQ